MMGLKHLFNTDIYHRLEKDINPELYENINRYLDHIFERGLINLDIYNFLTSVKKPRTPIIYFLFRNYIRNLKLFVLSSLTSIVPQASYLHS